MAVTETPDSVAPAVTPTSEARGSSGLRVLRIRDFRFLLLSSAIMAFGFEMRAVTQSWLALELTDSQAWVGAVNGVPAFAMVAFSLVGGVVADRFPKRDILAAARIIQMVLMFIVGYLVAADLINVWHLIGLALVQGSVVAFGMPANTSIIVELVGRRNLLSGTSLVQTFMNIGLIVGPAIGGVLLGLIGIAPVYFIVGAFYLAGAGAILLIRSRQVHRSPKRRSALAEIKEGLVFVRDNPLVRTLLSLNALGMFAGFIIPIIPVYARDVLEVGESGYGFLMMAFGIGGAAGTLTLVAVGSIRRKALLLVMTILVWNAGMVVFAFSRDYYLSLFLLGVMGAGGLAYVTIIATMIQGAIPDELRGRVTSVFAITWQLFPLGFLLGGVLAAMLGNETALVIGAIGGALPPLAAYGFSRTFREAT